MTGDSFATEISILTNPDLKTVSKKIGWLFSWKDEFKEPARGAYKPTIANNSRTCKFGSERKPCSICRTLRKNT